MQWLGLQLGSLDDPHTLIMEGVCVLPGLLPSCFFFPQGNAGSFIVSVGAAPNLTQGWAKFPFCGPVTKF